MNAVSHIARAHRPVVIQRPYERETFAKMSYTMDEPVDLWGNPIPMGVPLCGMCDKPIANNRCDDCCILFVEHFGEGSVAL